MSERDDSFAHWQGRVDVVIETCSKRIDTLFEALEVANNRTQLLDDELTKCIREVHGELKKEVNDLGTKLSNLTSRLAVIAAIGSFVGTVVTSLFVAMIIKIFIK